MQELKKFLISLSTFGEYLEIFEVNGQARGKYKHTLTLTSIVLESFHELIKGEKEITPLSVKNSIKNICVTLGIDNNAESIYVEYEDSKYKLLLDHIKIIYFAVNQWIAEKNFATGKILDIETTEDKARVYLQSSLAISPAIPIIYGPKVWRQHSCNSLLPLLWAEIWFNIEMKVQHIKVCPHCSTIYITPVNNPNKSNCGSTACKKQHTIAMHGGEDGYKAWLRKLKKKQKIGGKVGRPSKSKEGD